MCLACQAFIVKEMIEEQKRQNLVFFVILRYVRLVKLGTTSKLTRLIDRNMKIVNDTFSCGLRTIVAKPEGVCCQVIELKLFGDEISEVTFYGGCGGNLKGIAALVKGQKISDVKQRLQGITCGPKSTSCPDQFSQLLAAIDNK